MQWVSQSSLKRFLTFQIPSVGIHAMLISLSFLKGVPVTFKGALPIGKGARRKKFTPSQILKRETFLTDVEDQTSMH